jgi:dCMP deaminase
MLMAIVARSRATCHNERVNGVGCVIASSAGHILCTGYNGSPPGEEHCDDVGHRLVAGRCVRTVHAEQNAVAQAAKHGTSLMGAVAYTTNHPCMDCAKLLAAAGITRVVYLEGYRPETDALAESLVPGVRFEQLSIGTRRMLCQRPKGHLIVIEGIDGAGKSTVARMLAERMRARLVSEPGGTVFGDRIRAAMVGLDQRPCPEALSHAFTAARAQLMHDTVGPALERGETVVSDRSFISSMAYQCRNATEMTSSLIRDAEVLDAYRAWPETIVLLDLPAEVAVARLSRDKDIGDPGGYDTDALAKHEERRARYHTAIEIVERACDCHIMVVDATRDPEGLAVEISFDARPGGLLGG